MSYLPDTYKHFERTFPTVHAAHQELARRCYEGGPLDERSARLVAHRPSASSKVAAS
jgi:hypothetical protein